jgi:hypothetical protein
VDWFGLNWGDILIGTFVLAIVPFAFAAYGGQLATETIEDPRRKRSIKIKFWGMFVIGVAVGFWQQFRSAEADLDRATKDSWVEALASSKFPPPPAPVVTGSSATVRKARMEFIFFTKDIDGEPLTDVSLPSVNASVAVTFSMRVVGSVIPKDGALWIQICDQCSFAEAMPGFLPDKDNPHLRSFPFRLLYPGTVLPRMTATITFPNGAPGMPVDFFFACANCASIDTKKPQRLAVKMTY